MEKHIEARLIIWANRKGWLTLKFTPPAAGYPDRIFLKNGHCFFVEVKDKGKAPRELQIVRMQELKKLGFKVFVFDGRFNFIHKYETKTKPKSKQNKLW